MKAFRIGFAGWEEQAQYVLTHPTKTFEEFNTDCASAIKKAIEETMNKSMEEINVYFDTGDLTELAAEKLVGMGYSYLEFEGDYHVPGDEISFGMNRDSKEQISNIVGDELADKFVSFMKDLYHNKTGLTDNEE
ncbi:MAG: hypothetical protein AABY15_02775 [Nanoarchaeota archaeon]